MPAWLRDSVDFGFLAVRKIIETVAMEFEYGDAEILSDP